MVPLHELQEVGPAIQLDFLIPALDATSRKQRCRNLFATLRAAATAQAGISGRRAISMLDGHIDEMKVRKHVWASLCAFPEQDLTCRGWATLVQK